MKRFAFLLSFFLSSVLANAQMSPDLVIAGYVTALGSGAAVEGYPVYVTGPNATDITVYTNANGWYITTIPNGSVTGPNQLYLVSVEDSCNFQTYIDTVSNNQGTVDEALVNFQICTPGGNNCNADIYSVFNEFGVYEFHAVSNNAISSYEWNMFLISAEGDTLSSSIYSTQETAYYSPIAGSGGTHLAVCLLVTFESGCTWQDCALFEVNQIENPCSADFSFSVSANGAMVVPAEDYNQSFEYYWLVNGTLFSQTYFPQELNITPGEHTICHIVVGENCMDTLCQNVVYPIDSLEGCQAFFEWTVAPNNPNALIFNDASYTESPNVSYAYYYNNQLLGTTPNVDYNFGTAGSYVICLTITTGTCNDTYCATVYVPGIENPGDCNPQFEWDVVTEPVNGVAQVNFYALGDNPGFGQTENYWYIGNNLVLSGAVVEAELEVPGVYSVCHVVVNNATNCIDSLCLEVVLPGDTTNGCEAAFEASVSANNPLRMVFANTSYTNDSPVSYSWTFGDGTAATSMNAEHTYDVPGYYTVCLAIATPTCSDIICQDIYVPGEAGTDLSLGGLVFAGNYNADLGSARLFSLDPVSMAVELIQTTPIDSGYYVFTGLEAGTYLVKAGLNDNSDFYGDYVPTYFGSQYYWFDAQPINLTENGFDYHISLIWSGNNGGPGWVNGDIDDGPYRLSGAQGASSALLVSDADVIVSDLSGNPQRFTLSDSNGEFMIADLAFGTYRLMADVAGMICIPVEFTISENTPNVSISLVMGDEITGLVETPEVLVGAIYPNPAAEQVNLSLILKHKETLNISITTTAGQLIRTESRTLGAGTQTLGVPVSDMANGLYFIRLLDANNKIIGTHKISVMH